MKKTNAIAISLVLTCLFSSLPFLVQAENKGNGRGEGQPMIGQANGMPNRASNTPPMGTGTPRFGTGTPEFAERERNQNGEEGVVGVVSAISNSIISLLTIGKSGTTTVTIDASSAVIMKYNATTTIASMQVGDMIAVQGDTSSTTISAKKIIIRAATSTPLHQNNKDGNKENGIWGKISNFFKKLGGKNNPGTSTPTSTPPTISTTTASGTQPIAPEKTGFTGVVKKFFHFFGF
jgi:hypothetical protein